jgi:hypothetical protein
MKNLSKLKSAIAAVCFLILGASLTGCSNHENSLADQNDVSFSYQQVEGASAGVVDLTFTVPLWNRDTYGFSSCDFTFDVTETFYNGITAIETIKTDEIECDVKPIQKRGVSGTVRLSRYSVKEVTSVSIRSWNILSRESLWDSYFIWWIVCLSLAIPLLALGLFLNIGVGEGAGVGTGIFALIADILFFAVGSCIGFWAFWIPCVMISADCILLVI